VRVDGRFDFKSISIDPKAVDPDDPSILEDLVLVALRDATGQLHAGQSGALGGVDLGGLGGLLGGE
jgi:DNA-binding protein YbaB